MTIKQGSRGEEVKQIQAYLGLTVDGNFGPKTHGKVCEWQHNNSLTVDGVVGPLTGSVIMKNEHNKVPPLIRWVIGDR